MNKVLGVVLGVMFHHLLLDFFLHSLNAHVQPFQEGAVPGTFTCLKWSLVPPDFNVLYKIFMKIVQIVIKSIAYK